MYALLFALLAAAECWRRAKHGFASVASTITMTLCAAGIVGVRHAALAFVPAVALLLMLWSEQPMSRRAKTGALVVAGSVVSWLAIHVLLEQGGAFPLFSSSRDALGTACTMIRSVGGELGPFPAGILVFFAIAGAFGVPAVRRRSASVLRVDETSMRHGDVLAFVATPKAASRGCRCTRRCAPERRRGPFGPTGAARRRGAVVRAGSRADRAERRPLNSGRWALLAVRPSPR